jgi:hypothetical protein
LSPAFCSATIVNADRQGADAFSGGVVDGDGYSHLVPTRDNSPMPLMSAGLTCVLTDPIKTHRDLAAEAGRC